jgi:hypothetical protein
MERRRSRFGDGPRGCILNLRTRLQSLALILLQTKQTQQCPLVPTGEVFLSNGMVCRTVIEAAAALGGNMLQLAPTFLKVV